VKEFVDYEELFYGFLLAGLLLIISELFASKTLMRSLP